jgi:hypothetical protein
MRDPPVLIYFVRKREADGWNEYTYYYPSPGSLDQFNGDWVGILFHLHIKFVFFSSFIFLFGFCLTKIVPSPPGLGYRGEVVFLFTGLEPVAEDAILQPVLQWGYSSIGGTLPLPLPLPLPPFPLSSSPSPLPLSSPSLSLSSLPPSPPSPSLSPSLPPSPPSPSPPLPLSLSYSYVQEVSNGLSPFGTCTTITKT